MKVKDIMIKDVVSVRPEDSFHEIVELFAEKKISGAPVAIGDKPVGMVSESDIMKYILNKNLVSLLESESTEMKDKASLQARDFMSKEVIFVKPGDDLSKVIKIMNEKDINRVPVVEKGKLTGIITRADVVSVISEYLSEHPIPRKKEHEIDEPKLETDIDKLLVMVKERGSLKFSVAAKEFQVTTDRIEEWGKILEEYKLVKLHYPPIGDPTIKIFKEKKHAKKG
ncbi:MAG: CBS domain-containing protein [Candidatus Aenigmarchaeota archaeon]|nr:CBS domain-containing protein [Candidatus Aenigmarchaeota archaeon]